MSCTQTLSGITRDCASGLGGIKRVLLANKDDVTAITVSSDVISAITMASGKTFEEYLFRRNTGSLTSTWQVSDDSGQKYVQSDLTMVFGKLETTKRVEIVALAQADLVAIVEDMNGKFWFLGYDYPVFLTDGSDAVTGTNMGDRNGYTVVLRDESAVLPYEVSGSIISGLL